MALSDLFVFRDKEFSARKLVILLLLVTGVLILYVQYLKPSIGYHEFKDEYKSTIKRRQKIVTSVQNAVFVHENFENTTDACPYYGPRHGLFHPTVEHPRFIVTGGAGFIGSHLVKRLRQQYKAAQIKVLDNLWRGRLHNLQFENGTWAISIAHDFCLVDLRSTNNALKFVTGTDVIFHLAGVVAGVNYVLSHQSFVFRHNILINTNTLYAARRNKVQQFIYVGTASILPNFLQMDLGIHSAREEQTDPVEPESSYGWSKLIGEYETELAESDDFNVGILRLHHVYGPYSDYSATTEQVIPLLIRKALNYQNGTFVVRRSGKQYRDFVYVDDVVNSLLALLERGMNKGVIQVGTAKATTINELIDILNRLMKTKSQRKMDITFNDTQSVDDSGQIANLDRAKHILKWQPKVNLEEGILATMLWMEKNHRRQRVLVIIIGQARGGDLAWKSLYKLFIRPLNAHLALYISNWQTRTFLHNISQYIWTIPDYADWGVLFEMAVKECKNDSILEKWRDYCKFPGQFMGGVANCKHPGSAGILLGFRWLVQQKILELNLLDKYDWFILTRADELYFCNHHNFFEMNENHALLPVGAYYGGWSDRHIIGRPSVFMEMINITTKLVCEPDYWLETLRERGPHFNLEGLQRLFWAHMNISVSEFPRSMFTVRTQFDPTRWAEGQNHPEFEKFGLKIKYLEEFELVIKHCNITNITDALEITKQYGWEE